MLEYDYFYGDVEVVVENGEFECGSVEYEEIVGCMKLMW